MKTILLFAMLSVFSAGIFAQDGPLNKGDVKINLGLGIGSYLGSSNETQRVPPLSVSAEYAISDGITVGGIVGYYASGYDYHSALYNYSYRFTHKLIGARLNYYYEVSDKIDAYGGAGLGYNIVGLNSGSSSSYLDDGFSASGIFYTLHVGGRYNFAPHLGAFAELGYGFTALNLGLTLNIRK